ncbi:MAG: DUF362 domain-containing protein [Phascolarctobacterium sp.]|nr:DUF362 domain-containing protein [Phascolarctobacterium sp.]
MANEILNKYPQAPVVGCVRVDNDADVDASVVYFTKKLDAEHLIKMYNLVNQEISGKVAIKLHTGEEHGPNILPRAWVKALQATIPNSKIVETNTLYKGTRYTTEAHRKTLEVNGWTFCDVDIMDEFGSVVLPVKNPFHLKEVSMGKSLVTYDSLLVLTHFKGHAMGGFGGSMKNIAIGCADGREGKATVHAVDVNNQPADWNAWPAKELLMENMADSAMATCDFFGKKITFVNVLRRMSVDCDCAGTAAAEPTIPDIGIIASTDILAADQASMDLVYNSAKNQDLVKRIETRHGLRQLSAMSEHHMGKKFYKLVEIE